MHLSYIWVVAYQYSMHPSHVSAGLPVYIHMLCKSRAPVTSYTYACTSASLLVPHACIIHISAQAIRMRWGALMRYTYTNAWQMGGIHTSSVAVGSMPATTAVPSASTAAPMVPPQHVCMFCPMCMYYVRWGEVRWPRHLYIYIWSIGAILF